MATCEYVHCCEYAFPNKNERGCLIGIFNKLVADRFPYRALQFVIGAQLWGSPLELVDLGVSITRPNGDVIIGPIGQQVRLGSIGGLFISVDLTGSITFPEAGRYVASISSGSERLTALSFHVVETSATRPN